MVHSQNKSNILRESYEKTVVQDVDTEDVRKVLGEMSYEKVKVVFVGNDLLKMTEILPEPASK